MKSLIAIALIAHMSIVPAYAKDEQPQPQRCEAFIGVDDALFIAFITSVVIAGLGLAGKGIIALEKAKDDKDQPKPERCG